MAEQPTYLVNLRNVTRAEIESPEEHSDLVNELYGQSDRASALLFAALVERSLEALLKTKMRETGLSAIFGADGILGSFGSKIKMAYSLSLIGLITRHDLDLIRAIRNEFAHSIAHFSFSTPEVKPCCDALKILDRKDPDATRAMVLFSEDEGGLISGKTQTIHDTDDPKSRYVLTCNNISHRMLVARGKGGAFRGEVLP